jgi:RNA polymerase sigma-70 factor (ECF subfamily)
VTTWPPHMNESEDTQLVEAARNGDVRCFAELYKRHYVRMVGVAYCILSDRHLAEDAAQEAFAIACRELGRLRCAEKFASWLGVLCRNVANRMARRRTEVVASEDVPAPRSDASRDGLHQAVRQTVQNLPIQQREVVMLRYFSGLSYEQIAAALGISSRAVNGRLTRAKRKMAESLKRKGLGKEIS